MSLPTYDKDVLLRTTEYVSFVVCINPLLLLLLLSHFSHV